MVLTGPYPHRAWNYVLYFTLPNVLITKLFENKKVSYVKLSASVRLHFRLISRFPFYFFTPSRLPFPSGRR
jgi:hypothetical protein